MSVFFKSCLKHLLMNRDLQFCTIRGGLEAQMIGGAPVGHHLVVLGSVNCKPVNRNFSEFLSKGRPRLCLSAHIQLKLEIVQTEEMTTKIEKTFLFLVGGCGPIS